MQANWLSNITHSYHCQNYATVVINWERFLEHTLRTVKRVKWYCLNVLSERSAFGSSEDSIEHNQLSRQKYQEKKPDYSYSRLLTNPKQVIMRIIMRARVHAKLSISRGSLWGCRLYNTLLENLHLSTFRRDNLHLILLWAFRYLFKGVNSLTNRLLADLELCMNKKKKSNSNPG